MSTPENKALYCMFFQKALWNGATQSRGTAVIAQSSLTSLTISFSEFSSSL